MKLPFIDPSIVMSQVKKAPAIGIDLGTTYSCVAYWNEVTDKVEIIANDQGNRTTPSYVAFTDSERLIGNSAKNQCGLNPENTVFDAKRLIGRKYGDSTVQNDMKHWPFHVVRGQGDTPMIEITYKGELKKFRPEEISAMILTKMKEIAETALGQTVTNAVITVPAYFNDAQRQTTIDAGTIAGLNVLRIINEPTAAIMAYGLEKRETKETQVLVFDFGGGTLDCTLSTIDEGIFEVKATSGDTHLGGEDLDNILADFCAEEFKKKHHKDIKDNPRSMRRLRSACERGKQTLSSSTEALVEVDSLFDGIDFQMTITRSRFEHLCMPIFKRCFDPVERVLKDAKMAKGDVHEIVLVGGSTRIPKIQQMLSEFFNGKALNKSINPDEAVAYGAAVQAFMLNGGQSKKTQDILMIDVAPLTLGLETQGRVMTPIISRNTKKPAKRSQIFTTAVNNQPAVTIRIFEGERPLTSDNNLLGTFDLDGIPPAPAGVPQIEVTFDLDANGILNVLAQEKGTGKEAKTVINRDRLASSKDQIQKMIDEAEKFKDEDQKNLKKVEARSQLQHLVTNIQSSLDKAEFKDKISGSERDQIQSQCQKVSQWLASNLEPSMEDCERQQKDLEAIWNPIVMKIYQSGSVPSMDPNQTSNSKSETGGVKIEEVD